MTQPLPRRFRGAIDLSADEERNRLLGAELCDWWSKGKREWLVRLSADHVLDLRQELLHAMSLDLRICALGAWLRIDAETGESWCAAGWRDNLGVIGRDLLSWWNDPAGRHKVRAGRFRVDLRGALDHNINVYRRRRDGPKREASA